MKCARTANPKRARSLSPCSASPCMHTPNAEDNTTSERRRSVSLCRDLQPLTSFAGARSTTLVGRIFVQIRLSRSFGKVVISTRYPNLNLSERHLPSFVLCQWAIQSKRRKSVSRVLSSFVWCKITDWPNGCLRLTSALP